MNFDRTLQAHFPGAMPEADFVAQTYRALQGHGFNADDAIACVSVCRDELTAPFVETVCQAWGEAFNFSSLGGMLFLGKTGFAAAHHHAPLLDGRERYVYYAMPHIGIGEGGEIGQVRRRGRAEPSGACGALIAFRGELLDGRLNLSLDADDIEQSLLKQRLFRRIRYGDTPDLVSLTRLARQTIQEDLERGISLTVNPAHSDYAVLTGIQIHGSEGRNFIWPGAMYAVVQGERREISVLA